MSWGLRKLMYCFSIVLCIIPCITFAQDEIIFELSEPQKIIDEIINKSIQAPLDEEDVKYFYNEYLKMFKNNPENFDQFNNYLQKKYSKKNHRYQFKQYLGEYFKYYSSEKFFTRALTMRFGIIIEKKILSLPKSITDPKSNNLNANLLCPHNDIVFLIDQSGSIDSENNTEHIELWKSIAEVISSITKKKDTEILNHMGIGMVEFNSNYVSQDIVSPLPYKQRMTDPLWLSMLAMAKTLPTSDTKMHVGLEEVKILFEKRKNPRGLSTLILISDGRSQTQYKDISIAQEIKNLGVTIYAISPSKETNFEHLQVISGQNEVNYINYKSMKKHILNIIAKCN